MVKTKQNKDKRVVTVPKEEPTTAATPSTQSSLSPEEQFAAFVAQIKTGFDSIGDRLDAQDKKINQISSRAAAVAKTAAGEPKKANLGDTIKGVMDFLNSPMIQKVADKFLSSEPEAAAPAVDERLLAETQKRIAKMDNYQDRWMEAMIKGVELKNDQLAKELKSDLFG